MYIIQAISTTNIVMYFTGIIQINEDNKYIVEPQWGVERRFSTRFATEALADKIADAFRFKSVNIKISVEYERD